MFPFSEFRVIRPPLLLLKFCKRKITWTCFHVTVISFESSLPVSFLEYLLLPLHYNVWSLLKCSCANSILLFLLSFIQPINSYFNVSDLIYTPMSRRWSFHFSYLSFMFLVATTNSVSMPTIQNWDGCNRYKDVFTFPVPVCLKVLRNRPHTIWDLFSLIVLTSGLW
jgi:hypothetical protein